MHCDRHADAEASRQCMRCHKWHCEPCIRKVKGGHLGMEACSHCDGLLRHAPTETVREGGDAVMELLKRIISKEGLITAAALATPAFAGIYIGFPLYFIYFAAITGYYFLVVDHVARGRAGLPGPTDHVDDISSIIAGVLRGILVIGVGSLPFILWSLLGGNTPGSPVNGWFPTLALHVLGFVMMPAIILSVVMTQSTLAALWPFTWAAVISRAPGPYFRMGGVFALSTFVLMFATAGGFFFLATIPVVGMFFVIALTNLFLIVQAALLGGFVHRERLSFGDGV